MQRNELFPREKSLSRCPVTRVDVFWWPAGTSSNARQNYFFSPGDQLPMPTPLPPPPSGGSLSTQPAIVVNVVSAPAPAFTPVILPVPVLIPEAPRYVTQPLIQTEPHRQTYQSSDSGRDRENSDGGRGGGRNGRRHA